MRRLISLLPVVFATTRAWAEDNYPVKGPNYVKAIDALTEKAVQYSKQTQDMGSDYSFFSLENVAVLIAMGALCTVIKILWSQHKDDMRMIRDELSTQLEASKGAIVMFNQFADRILGILDDAVRVSDECRKMSETLVGLKQQYQHYFAENMKIISNTTQIHSALLERLRMRPTTIISRSEFDRSVTDFDQTIPPMLPEETISPEVEDAWRRQRSQTATRQREDISVRQRNDTTTKKEVKDYDTVELLKILVDNAVEARIKAEKAVERDKNGSPD